MQANKFLTTVALLALMSAGLTMLAACSPDTPRTKLDPELVAQGEVLFSANCSECHPRSGRGDYLKRIPATLLARRSEQELMTWIAGTDEHREMPFFDHLPEDELLALATFLRSEITK